MSTKVVKLANKVICGKCRLEIKSKTHIDCKKCRNILHLKCADITLKHFNGMTKALKNKWKCYRCSKNTLKTLDNSTRSQLLTNDPTTHHHSFSEDLSYDVTEVENSTAGFDLSRNSLPELSTMEDSEITELKQEIEKLSYQLESAHEEVAKLNIENFELKKTLAEHEKQIKVYKRLLCEVPTSNHSTPINIKNKKSINEISTGTPTCIETENASLNSNITNKNVLEHTSKKAVSISDELMTNKSAITVSRKPDDEKPVEEYLKKESLPNAKPAKNNIKKDPQKREINKQKIVILSDSSISIGLGEKMTSYINSLGQHNFNTFCYTKQNASTDSILESCITLASEMTSKDYLILLTGHNDSNCNVIVNNVYSALRALNKTNVLVLNVLRNKFLNEYKLNHSVKSIVLSCKNAKYIHLQPNNFNHEFCKTLYFEINCKEYERLYLTSIIEARNNYNKKHQHKTQARKGTIPFYFKPINKKNNETPAAKKGTIPYYFSKIKNNPLNKQSKNISRGANSTKPNFQRDSESFIKI